MKQTQLITDYTRLGGGGGSGRSLITCEPRSALLFPLDALQMHQETDNGQQERESLGISR